MSYDLSRGVQEAGRSFQKIIKEMQGLKFKFPEDPLSSLEGSRPIRPVRASTDDFFLIDRFLPQYYRARGTCLEIVAYQQSTTGRIPLCDSLLRPHSYRSLADIPSVDEERLMMIELGGWLRDNNRRDYGQICFRIYRSDCFPHRNPL